MDLQGSKDIGLMLIILKTAHDEAIFVILEISSWIVIEDDKWLVDLSIPDDNLLDVF